MVVVSATWILPWWKYFYMLENDVILTAIYGIIRAVPMNLSHLTSVHNMFQLLYGNNNMYCRKNNLRAHRVGFAAFSCAIRNWWKKPCISYVVKCIIRWESDGRKVPICWKKMRTNFPGSPNSMDFATFSNAMGNWRGNPCISHSIKFTAGCQSNGKKAPILWEKCEYQFPRLSTYDGFCRIFLGNNFQGFSKLVDFPAFSYAKGNWWENPCISHMMKYTTGWKSNRKNHAFYGKSMETNFLCIPHSMGFVAFSDAIGDFIRKPMHFPCNEVYHRMWI